MQSIDTKIRNLLDCITGKPITKILNESKIKFTYQKNPFYNLFVVCSDEVLNDLEEYLQQEFDIAAADTYRHPLSIGTPPYPPIISDFLKTLSPTSNLALVLATGFEQVLYDLEQRGIIPYRAAHDYTQEIAEDNKDLIKMYEGRKILIVTHIGMSKGKGFVEKAIQNKYFGNSRFIDGFIEVQE